MINKNKIKSWALNSVVLHLLFWSLSFYILLHIFSGSSIVNKIDLIYTAIFLITIGIAVFINLYLLVPLFLHKKRYFPFAILFIINLLAGSYFNHLLFSKLIDYILPGYYFISYYSYWDIVKFFLAFLTITTLLKLSKEWFTLSEAKQKITALQKEKIEAELNALRNQINPHFLFNSLNVLYGLVRKNAPESPEAILKLSDILRYVLYEVNTEYVLLQKELILLKNYMDLQKYRTSARVNYKEDIDNNEALITPMLLLPIFENAYKHGVYSGVKDPYINAIVTCHNNYFSLALSNNKNSSNVQPFEKKSGIGLSNIKKRLNYYYKDRYKMNVQDENDVFTIELQIELSSQ